MLFTLGEVANVHTECGIILHFSGALASSNSLLFCVLWVGGCVPTSPLFDIRLKWIPKDYVVEFKWIPQHKYAFVECF